MPSHASLIRTRSHATVPPRELGLAKSPASGHACGRLMPRVYGLRLLSQPGVQLAALSLIALVVVGFRALQFLLLTQQVQWGYDFSAYWAAAGSLLAGEPLYATAQLAGAYAPQAQYLFLYPPPFAVAAIPFAALFSADYRAAAWTWWVVGAAILVTTTLALHRSERLGDRFPILAGHGRWLLVAGVLAFPPVIGELVLGNVHLLLLGLLDARPGSASGAATGGPNGSPEQRSAPPRSSRCSRPSCWCGSS